MHKCQQVRLQGSSGPVGPAGGKGFLGPEDSCGPTQTPREDAPCRAGPLRLLQRADQLRDRQDATLTDGSPCGQDAKCSTQQVSPLEVHVSARSIQRVSVSKPDTRGRLQLPQFHCLFLNSAGLTSPGGRVWTDNPGSTGQRAAPCLLRPLLEIRVHQTQAASLACAHGKSRERTQAQK